MKSFINTLSITPHPEAKDFKDFSKAKELMEQVIIASTSPNFNPNEELRDLMRQFCLVNLWFFIKFICGHSGPYNKINSSLHLEMCNWRQSASCMSPHARGAGFVFRGAYKSTIWTHGSIPWEIIRNPNIRIRVTSSRVDKAEGFRDIAKRTFDSNELFAYLFPEHVIKKSTGGFITPARTRNFPEPSVKVGSTGGASAGDHHDLLLMDDLIDEQDLNVENLATIEMENKINWFKRCEQPLLIPGEGGRVLVYGTRYAVDDLYDIMWKDCRSLEGYQEVECNINPDNKWDIYYRKIIENGKSIFPEAFSIQDINKMLKDDSWTAMTQYFNDPKESGLIEFHAKNVQECKLIWNEDGSGGVKVYKNVNNEIETSYTPLSSLNIELALDPAFTYKGVTAKTSRTALVVGGKDWEDNGYLLGIVAGYFEISKTFDIIFKLIDMFGGNIKGLLIESNAQQKVLEGLLKEERIKRGIHIPIYPEASTTDKDARIRSTLGHFTTKDKLFVEEDSLNLFLEEFSVFPMSKYKKDILDASEKVLSHLRKPSSPQDILESELDYYERMVPVYDNATGY